MITIILACLVSLALAAFALVAAGYSLRETGAICLLAAVLEAVAVWYFLRAAIRPHLIDDLGKLRRQWSTRLAGIQFSAVLAWWALLPAEWKAAVPDWVLAGAVLVSGAAFVVAQALKQSDPKKEGE